MSDTLEILSAAELLAEPIPHRPERGNDPIEHDNTPVPRRGEDLSRVLWRGRQWAVTEYGIECLDGAYCIKKARLAENVEAYGWPLHVTGKTWVDPDDFCTAWLVALALHGVRVAKSHVREAIARSYPAGLRPAASGRGRL